MNTLSIQEFKKEVVKSFSTRAAAYEAHAQVQSLAALLLSEFIAEHLAGTEQQGTAQRLPAGPILEVGCGTGFLSAHLLSHFPLRDTVVSDISEDMIKICKARLTMCPGFASERVTFETLDGEELDATERRFAAICCSFTLQWFGNPAEGIRKMAECLSPGGCIFFAVPGADTFSQWKELCAQSGVPFTGNPLPSKDQLTQWSQEAGLTLQLKEYSVDHHYPDVHSMLKALKASGTSTTREREKLTAGQLRRLLRAGTPSACGESQSVIPISYHILYGTMTK